MPLLLRREEADCLWAVWRMDEPLAEVEQALSSTPWVAEAQRRFQSLTRRHEWLTARWLLHTLTGRYPEISYLPTGRPCLADGSCQLSISHTKGYVALILSPRRVGIDIERIARRVERVAPRFLRDDEQPMPYQGELLHSQLLHWSAKETLFKCIDAEGVDLRDHLRIHPFQPQARGTFQAEEYRTERHQQFEVCYELHPDFVLTYTVV